jgi:hypothetical protein
MAGGENNSSGGGDRFKAPVTAEQFCADDGTYVLSLVRKRLGSAQDAEDVAQYILAQFVKREVWTFYDPEKPSTHTGKPIGWRSFLSSLVGQYLRGQRQSLGVKATRELLLCDTPTGEAGVPWVELHGGAFWDDYSQLDDEEFVTRMRNHLAMTKPWEDGPSPLALFDLLYARVVSDGDKRLSRKEVQDRFGLSPASASDRLSYLRSAMKTGVHAPPVKLKFDIGGVMLTAAEVRAAADALRSAGGNRVAPALAAVGCPLAGYGTKWFISLGRAEMRAHPHCKVTKGSHKGGHSSATKVALIHLLERVLEEAGQGIPVPEPEPVETLDDIFEAALWQLGLTDKNRVLSIVAAANRIYLHE